MGGMVITDSRGNFDALTRSESPQFRLRSVGTGEWARGIEEQCSRSLSEPRFHWVDTLTTLVDSLTKPRYPARAVMESFQAKKRWRRTLRSNFSSLENVERARGAPLFTDDVPDNQDSSEELLAFDSFLQDESYPGDIRELLRHKYDRRSS